MWENCACIYADPSGCASVCGANVRRFNFAPKLCATAAISVRKFWWLRGHSLCTWDLYLCVFVLGCANHMQSSIFTGTMNTRVQNDPLPSLVEALALVDRLDAAVAALLAPVISLQHSAQAQETAPAGSSGEELCMVCTKELK